MPSTVSSDVTRVSAAGAIAGSDQLAIEEPLEIRLLWSGGKEKTISITMRTPGEDHELALGFLFTEGIVERPSEIQQIESCGATAQEGLRNVVKVTLTATVKPDLARLERHFYTSSSCGVCGKTSLEALRVTGTTRVAPSAWKVTPAVIHQMPARLRAAQPLFDRTGGLHASALFSIDGEHLATREDVGRHNALDKLIGSHFQADRIPLSDSLLLVSGRASFELVQKAVKGGIPFMAAVGAPSSLAVELAREFSMTLVGFVRDGRFNVYTGGERIEE